MNARAQKPGENLPVPTTAPVTQPALRRSLPSAIAEFQSDAVELEERAPPRVARMTLYGITDPARAGERTPTFSFTLPGITPRQV